MINADKIPVYLLIGQMLVNFCPYLSITVPASKEIGS